MQHIIKIGDRYYGPFPTDHAAQQWGMFLPTHGVREYTIIELRDPAAQATIAQEILRD